MRNSAVFTLVALALVGCGDRRHTTAPIIEFPGPAPDPVLQAPEEAVIGGVTFRLGAYLWRDFMPLSPPDGSPLNAELQISAADAAPIPQGVRVDRIWVLRGDSYWTTRTLEERPGAPADPTLRSVARGGPKWGPGITVDVVARLRDPLGFPHYLRAREQYIGATR